jgi:class 3 adenylate cyclase
MSVARRPSTGELGNAPESAPIADGVEAAGVPDRGAAAAAGEQVGCVVVVRAMNFDQLVEQYNHFYGTRQGEVKLRAEYAPIFTEAPKRTGLLWSNFNYDKDRASFIVESVDAAEALAAAILEAAHEANAQIENPDNRKQFLIGIAMVRPAVAGKVDRLVQAGTLALAAASDLVADEACDEIRVTAAAFDQMARDRRFRFGPLEQVGIGSDGAPLICRRRKVAAGGDTAAAAERCVMRVDMSQFSRIQRELGNALGPRQSAGMVARLQNQIKQLLTDGFRKAGSSYERACLEFGGDGGIFLFDDAAEAHKVAVQILLRAEEENRAARAEGVTTGMRCFRIGIAFGLLSRDGEQRLAGPVIATAVRLEGGGPSGEVRISEEAYQRLPKEVRRLYGGQEEIPGKAHDPMIRAHRYAVVAPAPWAERGPDGNDYEPGECPPPAPNPEALGDVVTPAALEECFIISPIDPNDSRIAEVFEKLIVPACRLAGLEPRRADQIAGPERMPVITGHLSEAPFAIAYMGRPSPGWRQDVVLEVGFRMATGKPLVLISEMPTKGADGRIPTFKELLPFHLVHKTITEVADRPERALDKLMAEIRETRSNVPREQWSASHPIIELKFANIDEGITFIEISPKAKELFGAEYFRANTDLPAMRTAMKARMGEAQYNACRRDFRKTLAELQLRFSGLLDSEGEPEVPMARVPIVFREEAEKPAGEKRFGHLPIIVRHSIDKGMTYVRILYLKVSSGLRLTKEGYYVCEL